MNKMLELTRKIEEATTQAENYADLHQESFSVYFGGKEFSYTPKKKFNKRGVLQMIKDGSISKLNEADRALAVKALESSDYYEEGWSNSSSNC